MNSEHTQLTQWFVLSSSRGAEVFPRVFLIDVSQNERQRHIPVGSPFETNSPNANATWGLIVCLRNHLAFGIFVLMFIVFQTVVPKTVHFSGSGQQLIVDQSSFGYVPSTTREQQQSATTRLSKRGFQELLIMNRKRKNKCITPLKQGPFRQRCKLRRQRSSPGRQKLPRRQHPETPARMTKIRVLFFIYIAQGSPETWPSRNRASLTKSASFARRHSRSKSFQAAKELAPLRIRRYNLELLSCNL